MKSKRTLALLGLLVVVLGIGVYTVSQSDSLQGSFPGGTTKMGGTITLSAKSPSGERPVSVSDDVFAFDLTAPRSNAVNVNSWSRLDFTFSTDADINVDAGGDIVALYMDGMENPVGQGYLVTNQYVPDTYSAYASVYFIWPIEVAAGGSHTFTLNVDSTNLLDEDGGSDDPLTVTMERTVAGSKSTVTGNTVNY